MDLDSDQQFNGSFKWANGPLGKFSSLNQTKAIQKLEQDTNIMVKPYGDFYLWSALESISRQILSNS